MKWFIEACASSIGRKVITGLTGLFLCLFLLIHLTGNLNLLGGEAKFDAYANFMHANPATPILEIGLLAGVFLHIAMALGLAMKNTSARGDSSYAMVRSKRGGDHVMSKVMVYTGLVILVFLLLHVYQMRFMKFGAAKGLCATGEPCFNSTIDVLKHAPTALFYILACVLLIPHVAHGFQSAFRSLGLHNERYNGLFNKISYGFALAVMGGFISLPVWALIKF